MSSPETRTDRGLPNGVRGLVLGVAAALVLGAAAAAQGVDARRLELESILREIPRDGTAPDVRRALQLLEMPAGSLAVLFDVLNAGELPRTEGTRGRTEPLGPARSETIVEVFRRAPREVVRACLREQAGPSSGVEERRTALQLYAAAGDSQDLVAVMRLCGGDEGEVPVLADELRTVFAQILSRDPDSYRALSAIVRRVPAALAPALARGVGDAGGRECLLPLVMLAGLQRGCEATALEEIARVALRDDAPFSRDVVDRTRLFLYSEDADVARAAMSALGALEDADAIDELITHLTSESPAARSASHQALTQISRQSFTSAAEMWRTWWDVERAWYEEEAPALLERLTAEDPTEVIAALRAIVPHRVFRHLLTPEVGELVDHDDPRVRRLACLALGQLGSAAAVPVLESALGDEEAADQARLALLSIRSNDQSGS